MALARFGLGFALAGWVITTLWLAAGGRVAAWQAVAGTGVGAIAAIAPMRTNRERTVAAVVVMCAVCLAFYAAHAWPDLSYDGLYDHQPATYALADGWNPWWDDKQSLRPYVEAAEAEVVSGYPKAAWLLGASLYRLTGNENSRHALHWLLILASLACAWCWARSSGARSLNGVLVALLCCASPVALYQATTSYVDGMVASLLSMLVVAMMRIARQPSRSWSYTAIAASTLLVGLKFTGLVYAGIVLTVFALATWQRPQRRKAILWVGSLSMCLGLALAGDSYLRNVLRHGNPFYPAVGNSNSVMAAQASPEFLQANRLVRMAKSLTSQQYGDSIEVTTNPQPRLPFSAWQWQRRYDSRFSGFGPLTLEVAILTMLLWLLRGAKLSAAGIAIVASALATDAGWWARLAPQLWILPTLLLIGPSGSNTARAVRYALIAMMLANVLIVASASLRGARADARQWTAAYAGESAEGVERYLATPKCSYAASRRLREGKQRSRNQ